MLLRKNLCLRTLLQTLHAGLCTEHLKPSGAVALVHALFDSLNVPFVLLSLLMLRRIYGTCLLLWEVHFD